ncbi:WD40-repeat-containing domain protein [Phakopsora pachyrhizi]|nr:WD40-repeat-containing domain protein [Phakopsora pachyrhizi]
MAQTNFLPLPNKDLITSFVFNYYGTRLAVSSLDHHLYLLSSDPNTGKWPEELENSRTVNPTTAPHISNTSPTDNNSPSSQRGNEDAIGNSKSFNPMSNLQSWRAHDGPVVKVAWSDPIYGELLASAGTDGTVRIWEEDIRKNDPSKSIKNDKNNIDSSNDRDFCITSWHQQTILADSNGAIVDLGFSPSETSLKLASISTDCHLRLYECLETSSLLVDTWNMIVNLDLSVLPLQSSTFSSDHLNPNPATVIATNKVTNNTSSNSSKAQHHPTFTSIRGFDPRSGLNNQKNNPLTGLRSSTTSNPTQSTSKSSILQTHNQQECSAESSGGWAMSWCRDSNYLGDIISVSCGSIGLIRILKFSGHSQWENIATLNPLSCSPASKLNSMRENNDSSNKSNIVDNLDGSKKNIAELNVVAPISSLAWAPSCGRDYQLIAAGHRDGRARIWRLVPPTNILGSLNYQKDWTVELDTELEDHVGDGSQSKSRCVGGGVGRCDWSATGTVLSTSGSDGKIRIWKSNGLYI